MFRKFRLAIFLGILVLVAAVAGGVSYWVFDDANAVYNSALDVGGSGAEDNATTDKIYENYSFSKTNQSDEYTFYFFPSTLYLEFDSNFGSKVKPEDVFGYNEVLFNDRGEILTNKNGDPSYDVVKSSQTMYLVYSQSRERELHGFHYEWGSWDPPVFDSYYIEKPNYYHDDKSGLYFESEEEAKKEPGLLTREQTAYVIIECDSYYDLLNTTLNGLNYYYLAKSTADNSDARNHGYPRFNGYTNEILSPKYNEFNDLYKSLELTLVNYRNEPVENVTYWNGDHRQYRNDRFGYWNTFYDLDDPNNADYLKYNKPTDGKGSRYLPIKITVNGSLSPELMSAVVPSPMSSMCNKLGYYYYYSNCWVYVDNETGRSYSKALDGFNSNSQSNIFDVMQNPRRYAVQEKNENGEVENVIRLYPVYSSGKVRSDDSDIHFGLTETPNDQLRANFTYANKFKLNNPLESVISQTMLTFSNEIINYNNGNVLTYAILNNVNLSQKDKYEEITIALCTYNGSEHSDGSTIAYTLDKKTLNSLIDAYGTGNYNFYVFVRRNRQSDFNSSLNVTVGSGAGDDGAEIKNCFTNNPTSAGNPFGNEYFKSLNKKNLIYFPHLNDDGTLNVDYSAGAEGNADRIVLEKDINRPLLFTFEKVSDLKMITDIPLDNLTTKEENGTYTGNFSWESDIDSYINEEYHNTQNMIVADGVYNVSDYFRDPTHDYNDGYVSDETILPATYPELSSNNPYIYVLQNVDFRYVNNLFFQIRIGDKYVQNAMDINVKLSDDVPQYIAYESGRDSNGDPTYTYFASQSALFGNNEKEYFIQKASVTDSNGVTREGLKLKDYYAKGLYDIMLVATSSENNKFKCNLYLKRHKIDFIKILDKDPSTTSNIPGVGNVGSDFVDHYDDLTDPNDANVLWESNFYIGDSLTSGSLSNKGQSIYELFNENCKEDGKLYGLYDSITDKPIAFFQRKSGTFTIYSAEDSTNSADKEINFFILLKNYVLYIKAV